MRLPQWGMGMQEGEIVTWFKREGEHVEHMPPRARRESSVITRILPLSHILNKGYPFKCSSLLACRPIPWREFTTQVRLQTFALGSRTMQHVWTTWIGCGGLRGSFARIATVSGPGRWPIHGRCAQGAVDV